MEYSDYIAKMESCPFCEDIEKRIIAENNSSYLTCAYAPYHKYHLLVVTKRHLETYQELKQKEILAIHELLTEGIKLMKKVGVDTSSIFLRDGGSIGKSIEHIHFHIIPDGLLVCSNLEQDKREFSEENALERVKEYKSLIDN